MEMEVLVSDFTDMTALQLFVFWDENTLEVTELLDYNQELLGFIAVLPEEDQARPEKGKLRINWFDGFSTKTLEDGTAICKFKFNMIGNECDVTNFTVADLGDAAVSPSLVLDASILVPGQSNPVSIGIDDVTPVPFQIPGVGCDPVMTSTENSDIASVRIYPNPVRDNLQVTFSNHKPESSSLMLYNEDGRLLSDNPLSSSESNIDISAINNGIYFYEIQDKGIVVHQGKIMKI